MNEFMSERAIALPSIFMRSTALILLVAFCGTALFGFTILYIFKPAPTQAFGFGGVITAILLMAYHTARDFLKAMAEAFVLRFISTMLLQLLRRLETLHVVKNIMYYADALQFNQYIGNKLNKIVDKPADPTQVKDTEADTNIANIIGVFSVLPIGRTENTPIMFAILVSASVSFTCVGSAGLSTILLSLLPIYWLNCRASA